MIHAVGTNYYKIGKSINPTRRITQISPKMPFECRLIDIQHSYFMSQSEKALHTFYQEERVNGEWFDLSGFPTDFYPLLDCGSYIAQFGYLYSIEWALNGKKLYPQDCVEDLLCFNPAVFHAGPWGVIEKIELIFWSVAEELCPVQGGQAV